MFFRNLRSGGAPTDPAELARRLGVPAPDQARQLVLYKYDGCPYCQRVLRALDELDVPVERRDTMRDGAARQDLRAITGGSQVPCLVIDGTPLLESADIVTWLRAYKQHGAAA